VVLISLKTLLFSKGKYFFFFFLIQFCHKCLNMSKGFFPDVIFLGVGGSNAQVETALTKVLLGQSLDRCPICLQWKQAPFFINSVLSWNVVIHIPFQSMTHTLSRELPWTGYWLLLGLSGFCYQDYGPNFG